MTPDRVPDPGEWHPLYEKHRTAITQWLKGELFPDHEYLNMPGPMKPVNWVDAFSGSTDIEFTVLRLRKTRARGLAVYTGQPFVWEWIVGVDAEDRYCAGEAYPAPVYGS